MSDQGVWRRRLAEADAHLLVRGEGTLSVNAAVSVGFD